MMTKPQILSVNETVEQTGLSRSTLWRYERQGLFPKRIELGPGRVGYVAREVQEWIQSRRRVA